MKKTHISLILFILFGIVFNNNILAWDDGVTHRDLSDYAAESSVLNNNNGDYLINLGFTEGLKEEFEWGGTKRTVNKWLAEGAMREDSSGPLNVGYATGMARSFNHFHNPLKEWSQAGLDDWIGPLNFTGESSLLWAQDGAKQGNKYEGNWSWKKTREYLYIALTGKDFSGNVKAITKMEREEYFARTFRGVGHQIHLLQDTAVPDHVRNDAHPEDSLFGKNALTGSYYFEEWAKIKIPNLTTLKSFAANPIYPNVLFNVSYNNLVPVTQLFDTDVYIGLSASNGSNQGLSEYTNANFFSNDTIFAKERYSSGYRHYFPFPRESSTDLQDYINQNKLPEIVIAEDHIPDTSFWIKKDKDGEIIDHFVRPGYMAYYINPGSDVTLYRRTFYRDDKCHEDYAALLLPRAVGYSAGLIDYFFRGELYVPLIVPSNDGPSVEGIWGNQTDTGVDIDKVAAFVQNNSKVNGVVEPIGAGILTLTVSFTDTKGTSDPDDDTIEYESAGSFSVTGIPDVNSDQYASAVFSVANPIQTQTIEDLTYHITFKGQLGNEQDAVIGRVIKGSVLHSVSPAEGVEGDTLIITGNNIPAINGPFPTESDVVRFQHDLSEPYTVEILDKTDTDITIKVPNTLALDKPEYGGLRVIDILDSGEEIYSTSLIFFPIAEGQVTNTGDDTINVTITADAPIIGDNNQLPLPTSVNISALAPGESASVQLKTGYTYTAVANTSHTQDIRFFIPNLIDFTFIVE